MDFAPAQRRTHFSTTKRNLFQSRLYGFSGHEFATFSDTQHKVDSARPLLFFSLSALLLAILSRLHPSSSSYERHGSKCQTALNDEASNRHNGLLVSRPYFNCSTHCIDRLLVLFSFFLAGVFRFMVRHYMTTKIHTGTRFIPAGHGSTFRYG